MRTLCIDSSLRGTGIYLSNNGKMQKCESWIFDKDIPSDDVLGELYWKIVNLYVECEGSIDFIVIEGNSYGYISKGSKSQTVSSEVQGLIKGIGFAHNTNIITIQNTTWKAVIGWETLPKDSKSNIKKYIEKTVSMFGKIHGHEFKTTDECDAYMLYLAYISICERKGRRTEASDAIYNKVADILKGGAR